MKVIISNRIKPNQGIATYNRLLVSGLKEINGIDYKLYEDNNVEEIFKTYNVIDLMKRILKRVHRDNGMLHKFIKNEQADIFHCTENYGIPWIGKMKCKVVTTIHDLIIYTLPKKDGNQSSWNGKMRFYYQVQHAIKNSDAIITVSEYSKREIVKVFPEALNKIKVIYLAPRSEFYMKKSNEVNYILNKYNISKPYILLLGGNHPRKNMLRAIKAFLSLNNLNYQLVITGNAILSFDENIKQAIAEDRIIFTDYVNDEDLVALYNKAYMFVYPSLFEGFGLPILEAMACGTPVITSNVTSMPEVAGDSAILINPYNEKEIKNAMERLIKNPNLIEIYKKRGLERCKKFTITEMAKRHVEVYKSII